MPLHWRPVGPEPESTYWVRRAVVAAAAVALVALVAVLLPGGGDDEPDTLAGAPSPAPTTAATTVPSTPTASPTPTAPPACAATALAVEAKAERDSYPVGGDPRLSLSVTNTGAAPCSRDLGPAQVELLVTSGSDRIWSSDDCSPGGDPDVVVLEPGKAVVQTVTWDSRRSRPGCAGDKERAQAGTYRVTGRVGDQRAEGGAFVLED